MTQMALVRAADIALDVARRAKEGMTPALLLQVAEEFEASYKGLLAEFPAGTLNDRRNAARDICEAALECAAWMERCDLPRAHNVGPFMRNVLRKGQRVRVRKGAVVFGTGPGIPRGGKVIQRDQVVTVRFFDAGYVNVREGDAEKRVRQAQLTWAGEGGYWRSTDANNVAPVDEAA